MPRTLLAFAVGTVLLSAPVSPGSAQQTAPATAPSTAPSTLTPEETAADVRMQRMIFLLDATATPGERLRAMKLVEQVLQGEIAAINANLPPNGTTDRLTRYRATLTDVQGRIKSLEPTVAQQGLVARVANARIEALAAIAQAQSEVAKQRAELEVKQEEVTKTQAIVKTLAERLKEPNLTKDVSDALRRELNDQETKLKRQDVDLLSAKAAAATADQALKEAQKNFQTDPTP